MKHATVRFALILALVAAVSWGPSAATVQLDLGTTYQTIEGFGGFGGMKPFWSGGPFYNDAFLELVVDEIGMTMIRTEFYPRPEQESNFTRQVNYLKAIKQYAGSKGEDLKFIATVWTPPKRFKTNNSTKGGSLISSKAGHYADYLVDYVKFFKQQVGTDLYALSPANEPQAEHFFNSCKYTPGELAQVIVPLCSKLKQAGLPTWVFFSDDLKGQYQYNRAVLGEMGKRDPNAVKTANIFAHHYGDESYLYYGGYGQAAVKYDARAWNTEFGNGPDSWDHAWTNAQAMYQMLNVHYSAIVFWLIGPHTNGSQSTESVCYDLKMGPKAYQAKAFFRYIRPGAVRVEATSDNDNILSLAFVHKDDKTLTVVMLNTSSSTQSVTVADDGGLPREWDVFLTGNGNNCVKKGTVAPGGSVSIPGKTIATLYNASDPLDVSVGRQVVRRAVARAHPSTMAVFRPDGRMVRVPGRGAANMLLQVHTDADGNRKADRRLHRPR